MASTESLLAKKKALKAALEAVNEQIKLNQKLTVVRCGKCDKGFRICNLEYIQTHWYVHPYSCTGGDYWKEGEGVWQCPRCGFRNRLYDKPEIAKLKPLFKKVIEEHKR